LRNDRRALSSAHIGPQHQAPASAGGSLAGQLAHPDAALALDFALLDDGLLRGQPRQGRGQRQSGAASPAKGGANGKAAAANARGKSS
jgi:hypothetical protein